MKKASVAIILVIVSQFTLTLCFSQLIVLNKNFNDTSELSTYIDSLYNANSFSGIVAVAKGNQILYRHFDGFANKEEKIPISENTIFDIASIGKMFTGVAIMQLVEKNKIRLNDPVSKYLPDYPNKLWSDKATIQDLLSHTSGIGDFWPPNHHLKDLYNLQEIVDTIANVVATNTPSKQMTYSNAGFYLLGRIIEKASGQNYADYVQKNVFDVAGMKNTYFQRHKEDHRFAKGYTLNQSNGQYETNEALISEIGGPAGGALTNISDLLSFETALKTNKLLSQKYFKEMTTIAVKGRMGMDYGLGIGVGTMPNGVQWIGHNGGAPGIAANFVWFVNSSYSVIVFMNQDAPSNLPLMLRIQMFASEMK